MPRTPFALPKTTSLSNSGLVTKARGGSRDVGEADYSSSVRSAVRGFWSGAITYDGFVHNMMLMIDRGFHRAWNEGASECGITPQDMTMEERDRLYSEINQEMSYITQFAIDLDNGRRGVGKLGPMLYRAEMWEGRYAEIRALARTYSCGDEKLEWVMNPKKEHCFPAGTMVDTDHGKVPIETIRINDRVRTAYGFLPVTHVFANPYRGKLIRIRARGYEVVCTPGHPFLTQRGWVRADRILSSDQVVIAKDFENSILGHIAFPNTSNGISAGTKISILGAISNLLTSLSFGKLPKPGVSVPIIPVGLDNKGLADQRVDNKLGLNQEERFVEDSIFVEIAKELNLKFCRAGFLNASIPVKKLSHLFAMFFGVILPVRRYLIACFGVLHRVVFEHTLAVCVGNRFVEKIFVEPDMEFTGLSKNDVMRKIDHFGDTTGSDSSVVFSENGYSLFGPDTRSVKMRATKISVTQSDMTAYRTFSVPLAINEIPRAFLRRIVDIATLNGAEPIGGFRVWLAAVFAGLHRNNAPSLDVLYHDGLVVYNIEVGNIGHYVANGFVVHNCPDCLRLSGKVYRASTWRRYNIYAKMPRLKCGGHRCGCDQVRTSKPVTPGRPPMI